MVQRQNTFQIFWYLMHIPAMLSYLEQVCSLYPELERNMEKVFSVFAHVDKVIQSISLLSPASGLCQVSISFDSAFSVLLKWEVQTLALAFSFDITIKYNNLLYSSLRAALKLWQFVSLWFPLQLWAVTPLS